MSQKEHEVPLLEVKNLHVTVDGKHILKGLDLAVNKGEVHAIMGPNGSGKSTLSYVMAGLDPAIQLRKATLSKLVHRVTPLRGGPVMTVWL